MAAAAVNPGDILIKNTDASMGIVTFVEDTVPNEIVWIYLPVSDTVEQIKSRDLLTAWTPDVARRAPRNKPGGDEKNPPGLKKGDVVLCCDETPMSVGIVKSVHGIGDRPSAVINCKRLYPDDRWGGVLEFKVPASRIYRRKLYDSPLPVAPPALPAAAPPAPVQIDYDFVPNIAAGELYPDLLSLRTGSLTFKSANEDIVGVGFMDHGIGLLAIQVRRRGPGARAKWRVPYFEIDTKSDFTGTNCFALLPTLNWKFDEFNHVNVKSLFWGEPEVEMYIRDDFAFYAYAAARNVMMMHYLNALEGFDLNTVCPYLAQLHTSTGFSYPKLFGSKKRRLVDGLAELIAWLFTINFAGRNVDEMGWQKTYKGLILYNKAAAASIGNAEDMTPRGFDEGLDPANFVADCSVFPNNGVDGHLKGASRQWGARAFNNFGASDGVIPWEYGMREMYTVAHDDPDNAKPRRPQMQRASSTAPPTNVLTLDVKDTMKQIISPWKAGVDDGSSAAQARTQHEADLAACQPQDGGVPEMAITNPAKFGPGAPPVARQMASLFGTLSHEYALVEVLGAAYSGIARKRDAVSSQMQAIADFVSEFPLLCTRVGNGLASKLIYDVRNSMASRAVPQRRSLRFAAGAGEQYESVKFEPMDKTIVSVDLQSAMPYTFPPLAAVPDAVFKCTTSQAKAWVVAEFKTQWKPTKGGFRWQVDGNAYRRQSMYELCTNWLTAGDQAWLAEDTNRAEAWTVVLKSPAVTPITQAVAYSARAQVKTNAEMATQIRLLYNKVFSNAPSGSGDENDDVYEPAMPHVAFMTPYKFVAPEDAPNPEFQIKHDIYRLFKDGRHLIQPAAGPDNVKFLEMGTHGSCEYRPSRAIVGAPPSRLFTRNYNRFRGPGASFVGWWNVWCASAGGSAILAMRLLTLDMALMCGTKTDETWAATLMPLAEQFDAQADNRNNFHDMIEMYANDNCRESAPIGENNWKLLVEQGATPAINTVVLTAQDVEHATQIQQIILRASNTEFELMEPVLNCTTALIYKIVKEGNATIAVPAIPPGNVSFKRGQGRARGVARQTNYPCSWSKPTAPGVELPLLTKSFETLAAGSIIEPIITLRSENASVNKCLQDPRVPWTVWPTFIAQNRFENSAARLNADVQQRRALTLG